MARIIRDGDNSSIDIDSIVVGADFSFLQHCHVLVDRLLIDC